MRRLDLAEREKKAEYSYQAPIVFYRIYSEGDIFVYALKTRLK